MGFFVHMAVDRPPDDVLEAVGDGLVTHCPLVEARGVPRRNVRDDDCNFTVGFKVMEGVVEPLKNASWVVSLRPNIEIEIVTRLTVNCYHVHFVKNCSIWKTEFLCIIANIFVFTLGIVVKPLLPHF
jgi:hypothetical protein